MLEIIKLLVPLAVAVLINILLGTYYQIGVVAVKFDVHKLLDGVIKAVIIGSSFVGLAYIISTVALGDFSIDPKLIMITAIGTYAIKAVGNLSKILGIEVPIKKV